MKDKLHIFTLLALMIFTSCEYELEDIEIKNIDKSTDVKIKSVDLNSVPDTVYLFNPTTFNYSIDISGAKEYSVFTIINGSRDLIGINSSSGEFTVIPEYYSSGVKNFTLEISAKSGTNSLADILDKEKIIYEKNLVFVMDNDPPTKMVLKKPTAKEGVLLIEWNKNKRVNFKDYYISVFYDDHYGCDRSYIISDQEQNYLELSGYQGGKITIEGLIRIKNYDYIEPGNDPDIDPYANTEKGSTTYNSAIVSFDTIYMEGENYVFCWNKSEYPKYFGKYFFDYFNAGPSSFSHETSDILDTCFSTADWKFGGGAEVSIRSFGKKNECWNSDMIPLLFGRRDINTFDNFFTSPEVNEYYYAYQNKIYDSLNRWIEIEVNQVGDKANNKNFAFTFNNKKLYVGSDIYIYEIEPTSLSESTIITANQINNSENVYPSAISISDNQRLLFALHNTLNPSDKDDIVSYNLISNTIEDTLTIQGIGYIKELQVNNNGSYVIWVEHESNKDLIKGARIENGKFVDIQNFEGANPFINPLNQQELFTFSTYEYIKYDLITLEFEKSYMDRELLNPSVDPITGYLGWLTRDYHYHVYDPTNNLYLASKEVTNHLYWGLAHKNFYLLDGKLFYINGFVYDFNLK